ncbi:MAG TPA: hypothetical protein VI036_11350 [Propionibacteriaceae bacterium]
MNPFRFLLGLLGLVEFVKINWSGEHQESGGELLTGLRLRSSAVPWRCSTNPDR